MPGKVGGFHLKKNDIVRVQTSGGGGYGDPLRRDPRKVMHDVSVDYLTVEQAGRRFGVVLNESGDVDDAATSAMRKQLMSARVYATLQSRACDGDEPRRRITLPLVSAQQLAVADGDLIELVTPDSAAPLRGWAQIGDGDAVLIDAAGLAVLRAKAGDMAEIRVAPTVPE